jgi:hypothetical protein
MKSNNSWNDMLLKAHFESLNPKWHDQESVMTLLSEISQRLRDPEPLTSRERESFDSRIHMFIQKGVRSEPKPMQTAGSKKASHHKRKTG